jgi:hypothetical protein
VGAAGTAVAGTTRIPSCMRRGIRVSRGWGGAIGNLKRSEGRPVLPEGSPLVQGCSTRRSALSVPRPTSCQPPSSSLLSAEIFPQLAGASDPIAKVEGGPYTPSGAENAIQGNGLTPHRPQKPSPPGGGTPQNCAGVAARQRSARHLGHTPESPPNSAPPGGLAGVGREFPNPTLNLLQPDFHAASYGSGRLIQRYFVSQIRPPCQTPGPEKSFGRLTLSKSALSSEKQIQAHLNPLRS